MQIEPAQVALTTTQIWLLLVAGIYLAVGLFFLVGDPGRDQKQLAGPDRTTDR